MKNFMVLLLMVGAFVGVSARADSLNCSGSGMTSTKFINGYCNRGFCNGNIPGEYLNASGNCDTGVTFNSQGYTMTDFINEYCTNGFIGFWLYGSRVRLSGTCSNGGRFEGELDLPADHVNGSCREDGPFNVYQYGRYVNFDGTCSKPTAAVN